MRRHENTFKKYLVKIMGTRWDVQSHEDKYSDGIADLSYGMNGVNGWIELKHILKFPPNSSDVVKPLHYTPQQVNWIRRRGRAGGHCYTFVKVAVQYYLFTWESAREVRRGLTKRQFEERSIMRWSDSVCAEELAVFLTEGLNESSYR